MRKSLQGYFLSCGAGILLAIAAYAIINAHVGYDQQQSLLENYVFPFEQLYANAMLMVGPLVVFFSLLKNASDAVIVSERILSARKLHVKAIVTSAFAVLLALGLSLVLMFALSDWRGYDAKHASQGIEWSFAEAVVSMVPASIFEPFESVSPIPLIVVALLATYALISAGRDFDVLKGAIDACYGVFSRMLGAIMAALPVACFLAILDVLLRGGHKTLFNTAVLIIFIIASTLVLFATYAVRLRARGIKVGPFFKLLLPLLRENHAIGSTIDAAPYNVRYCAKHYGMDRSKLSHMLPVLAQINRDGNCFFAHAHRHALHLRVGRGSLADKHRGHSGAGIFPLIRRPEPAGVHPHRHAHHHHLPQLHGRNMHGDLPRGVPRRRPKLGERHKRYRHSSGRGRRPIRTTKWVTQPGCVTQNGIQSTASRGFFAFGSE